MSQPHLQSVPMFVDSWKRWPRRIKMMKKYVIQAIPQPVKNGLKELLVKSK